VSYCKPYPLAVDETIVAAWDSQVAEAADAPWLAQTLTTQSADLFPRFAACFSQLRLLPRGVRRALQRRFARSSQPTEILPEWLQGGSGSALRRKLASSLAGMALLLALAQDAQALQIDVTTDIPKIIADGLCSVVEAIKNANDTVTGQPHSDCAAGDPTGADTIVFLSTAIHTVEKNYGPGTYGPTRLPVITSDITIEGNGSTITRQAEGKHARLMAVAAAGNLTLKNTIVTGGSSTRGGGVFNAGTLVIDGSTISANSATKVGGGVFNKGTATLSNSSVVTANEAHSGGGVHNVRELSIDGSTISDNTAVRLGGGINNNRRVTITNSVITGNKAGYGGGLFINDRDKATIDNTTISNNRAVDRVHSRGGGIFNDDATLDVTNSSITGNRSKYGGGVFNDGRFYLGDSTVTDNTATTECGGIFNYRPHSTTKGGSTTISGNHAPKYADICFLSSL
jgi:hypothetical protein